METLIRNNGERSFEGSYMGKNYFIPVGKEGWLPTSYLEALRDVGLMETLEIVGERNKHIETKPVQSVPEIVQKNIADFNFVTTLWTSNGMGRVGEELLLAFDRMGLKINVIPHILEKDGLNQRTLELLEMKYEPSEKTLFYSIPEVMERYATKYNYFHTDWDTTKAPQIWVDNINKYAEKVYPASDFTKDVFEASGVNKPLMTVKHGINTTYFPRLTRNWAGKWVFFTSGDISTRKGTDVLISAFLKAFPKELDVELIIKSNKSLDWGQIYVPDDKRIKVIEERLSPEDYLDLVKKAHVYVAPSRAEGFGLPSLEAMATGMGLIIHNWSGHSGMVNDKYNFVLPTGKEVDAPVWMYPKEYGDIGKWREPDYKKLADLMRWTYDHRDDVKKRAFASVNWVSENWTWDNAARILWTDMNKTGGKSWGEFYRKDTLTKNNVIDSVNSHKELFWFIRGFYPDKIIEAGTGTGEMSAFLSWDEQKLEGREPTSHHPKKIIAIDNDEEVLKLAKFNMQSLEAKGVKLVYADAFTYNEDADLIFSQGTMEHFSDDEARAFVDNQLKHAPILVHSVPNDKYGKLDYGNERLLSDEQWYKIFEGYDLTIYRYWGEEKTQSCLVFKRPQPDWPKVSIIMPVFNALNMTVQAIECVRQWTKDYELIVIDNGSTDGLSQWLDKQKDIRVVHSSKNLGVPAAKNIALALAKGHYICFLDNDTEAGEGWLESLLEVFSDPTVGFTANEGYMVDKTQKWFLGERFTSDHEVEWAGHSIFMFPRETLRLTGLLTVWDEWNGEDVEHCFKLRNEGYIGKLPKSPVNCKHLKSMTAQSSSLYGSDKFTRYIARIYNQWEGFINTRGLGAKIDLGVGFAPAPGYLHVDVQKLPHVEIIASAFDLPFADDTIAELRNAHLIEHFWKDDAPKLIKEWKRVLRPGGKLTIICPNLLDVFQKVLDGTVSEEQGFLWTFGGHLDQYDIHHWGYTRNSLRKMFEDNGFKNVTQEQNPGGWMQFSGIKDEVIKDGPKKVVSVYLTHHHTYGGGENDAMRVMNILQGMSRLWIASETWEISPSKAFGIEVANYQNGRPDNPDVYINFSHNQITSPRGKTNILRVFYPQYDWTEYAAKYDKIVTISDFSAKEIQRKWGLKAEVITPAVNLSHFKTSKTKKKQILSVGRFFWVDGGNNKNQHILVEAFSHMRGLGYKLILVGSVQNEAYYKKVVELATGLDVEFKHNLTFPELVELYAESQFYWHGAGYGTDEPSAQEHFGIVALEALASGCKTIVYNGGGIREITGVETWSTIDELVAKTIELATKPQPKIDLSKYDISAVTKQWEELING